MMSNSKELYCLFCCKIFPEGERKRNVRGGGNTICDDVGENENGFEVEEEFKRLRAQFFRILGRHLQAEKLDFETRKIFNDDVLGQVLRQCPDCSALIKSYCEYFEEIEVLKMKLNWKLLMLVKIVSCSEKVKPRIASFEGRIREVLKDSGAAVGIGGDDNDPMESVRELRKELVKKCSKKLREGTPIVQLNRCRAQDVQKCGRQVEGPETIGDRDVNQTKFKVESSATFGARDEVSGITQKTLIKTEKEKHGLQVEEMNRLGHKKVKMEIDRLGPPPPPIADSKLVSDVGQKMCPILEDTITEPDADCPPEQQEVVEAMDTMFEEHWELPPIDVTNEVKEISAAVRMVTETEDPTNLSNDGESCTSGVNNEGSVVRNGSVHPLLKTPEAAAVKAVCNDQSGAPARREVLDIKKVEVDPEGATTSFLEHNQNDGKIPIAVAAEPNARSELEAVMSGSKLPERRLSLRTRHKCSKCSVGFTSARNLKIHMISCGDEEAVSDNPVDEDEKEGDDDDKVEKVDAEIVDDYDDDDDTEDGKTVCDASDGGRDSDIEDDDVATAAANGKRRNYEFRNTRFNCDINGCKFYFYNQEDLENHSKLHGDFKCLFCDVSEAYAPDLSAHELNHNVKKLEMTTPAAESSSSSIKNDPVHCPRCTSEFKHGDLRSYTVHHIQAHLDLNPAKHSCPVCEYSCSALEPAVPTNLIAHFETNHDLEGVEESEVKRCNHDGCSAYFLTHSQIARHRLAVHLEAGNSSANSSTCATCGEHFSRWTWLRNHRVRVHKVGLPVPCDMSTCTERFEDEVSMNQHLAARRHQNQPADIPKVQGRTLYCHFCCKSYRSRSELGLHQDEVHHKRGPVNGTNSNSAGKGKTRIVPNECLICKAPFKIMKSRPSNAVKNIRKHYKTHHDLESKGLDSKSPSVARCSMDGCEAYFLNHFQLQVHRKRVHFNGMFRCSSCDKGFIKQTLLRTHRMNVHGVQMEFECPREACNDRFETQLDLDCHIDLMHVLRKRKDIPETPDHVCETCGKTFNHLAAFYNHKKTHEPKEDRRFICSECGKAFKKIETLHLHSLSHAGPEGWEFTCETCGKKCMTKQKLDEHQNVHAKAKPFTCEYCGLKYAHRHNFRYHLKDKHGVTLPDPRFGKRKRKV